MRGDDNDRLGRLGAKTSVTRDNVAIDPLCYATMDINSSDLDARVQLAAASISAEAEAVDADARFPDADVDVLATTGLIEAVVSDRDPPLVDDPTRLGRVLCEIGFASLTVGRLYEGHVNAAKLIATYGDGPARAALASEARAGRLLGVWNAERGDGPTALRVDRGWRITGRKVHCSGAGAIRRPVVTARTGDGETLMTLPDMNEAGITTDVGIWRASGMRGTATGTVDFDDVFVPDDAVIGRPGDYYRSPLFSGGAWRVLAVQLGGLRRILVLHAQRLQASGRGDDAVFRARFSEATGGYECARLLVAEAGRRAEAIEAEPGAIDAYVDQARGTFETLALAGIEAARRNVGLGSYIAPDPLDRCIRDLETYLRQPILDASRDSAARWLLRREGAFAT